MIDRQALIDEYIDSCENCGSLNFPRRRDCDGCTAAADEEIERLEAAQGDRFSAITKAISTGS